MMNPMIKPIIMGKIINAKQCVPPPGNAKQNKLIDSNDPLNPKSGKFPNPKNPILDMAYKYDGNNIAPKTAPK